VVSGRSLKIRSRANKAFKAIRAAKPSFGSETILVEGDKLIAQALAAGSRPLEVWGIEDSGGRWSCPEYLVPEDFYTQISPTRSGRPPLAVFPAPALNETRPTRGRHLLLDRIQDPGNAGALVRAAAAFGFDGVCWVQPCVYPFHHATIRASAGSVLRIAQTLWSAGPSSLPLIGSTLVDAVDLREYAWPEDFVLAMGNEGHGLSNDLEARLDTRITIPVSDRVESLNVAGAAHVLMFASRFG